MRRSFRISTMFLLLALAAPAAALAEEVQGRVAEASPYALSMVVYDPQGRPYPNALNLEVDGRTRLYGIQRLTDLRADDAIGAEVTQEESGVWYAASVTRFQDVAVQPATARPSPSLRDVLGNPVVRGALVGAATGAIASGASGGKAGKGALVGAGVGAAAGLLGELFAGSGDDSRR